MAKVPSISAQSNRFRTSRYPAKGEIGGVFSSPAPSAGSTSAPSPMEMIKADRSNDGGGIGSEDGSNSSNAGDVGALAASIGNNQGIANAVLGAAVPGYGLANFGVEAVTDTSLAGMISDALASSNNPNYGHEPNLSTATAQASGQSGGLGSADSPGDGGGFGVGSGMGADGGVSGLGDGSDGLGGTVGSGNMGGDGFGGVGDSGIGGFGGDGTGDGTVGGFGSIGDGSSGSGGGSGGGGGGGGKIICTAMNQAYGFGAFRNAIWMRHSVNLPKEYEIGYHAIFLPIVDFAFNCGDALPNRIVRRALEWCARHRTADIWMQRKGRRDPFGMMIRMSLDKLCYLVGKFIVWKGKKS